MAHCPFALLIFGYRDNIWIQFTINGLIPTFTKSTWRIAHAELPNMWSAVIIYVQVHCCGEGVLPQGIAFALPTAS